MAEKQEQQIVDSWQTNAEPWIQAVRQGLIASRLLGTDRAIVDSVVTRQPASVLDLGCGEGWLTRALVQQGIDTLGIDAVPALIDAARSHGVGRYRLMTYQALSSQIVPETFDVVVCNFSLFGGESVRDLFAAVAGLLNVGGAFIIQTLHPRNFPSADNEGWRPGNWQGFSDAFQDPAPWYFRNLNSWQALFQHAGFFQPTLTEPLHPQTGEYLSLIMTAEKMREPPNKNN